MCCCRCICVGFFFLGVVFEEYFLSGAGFATIFLSKNFISINVSFVDISLSLSSALPARVLSGRSFPDFLYAHALCLLLRDFRFPIPVAVGAIFI